MSVISDRHSFVPFVSSGAGKSKAMDSQRLLKVVFKSRNGESARQSVCASVPVIDRNIVSADINLFVPYVCDLIAATQDAIGRQLVIDGNDAVTTEQISTSAVLEYLAAQSKGDRITSADISDWFTGALEPILLVAFADKLGIGDQPTDEQAETLQRMCNVYREKLGAMAGGRTAYPEVICGKLLKALELCDSDDVMAQRLIQKLTAMQKVSVEDMIDL